MLKSTLLQRLECLTCELGLTEAEVLGRAIEAGINALYEQHVAQKYMAGQISHELALQVLGPQRLARLECIMRRECEEELDPFCGHA